MLSQKPYITLHIQTSSLPFEVYVNGAPVTADETGSDADITWPINNMLHPWRENEIAILVWTNELDDGSIGFEPGAQATLSVMLQQAGALQEPGRTIGNLHFEADKLRDARATEGSSPSGRYDSARDLASSAAGDVVIGAPFVRELNKEVGLLMVARTFVIPLPLPEWEFFSSEQVATLNNGETAQTEVLYSELLAAYEELWKKLKAGELDSVMPYFEERSRNTDRAFFLAAGTTQQRLRSSLQEAMADSSLQLGSLKTDGFWTLNVGPTQRLMRLVWGDHSSAIIRFADKEYAGVATTYPLTFRKQGSRYIIAL